jgi:hypothetical protein
LACGFCGYNLRTLEYAATCPECGRAVSLSPKRNKLIFAPRGWLERLRKGTTILMVTALATAFVQLILFMFWPWLPKGSISRESSVPEIFTLVFGFGLTTALFTGVWLVTSPRRAAIAGRRRKSHRDILQKALPALCLSRSCQRSRRRWVWATSPAADGRFLRSGRPSRWSPPPVASSVWW